ncbi:DUF4062 domain-containing protein [Cupriavidus consociatus]|uniref:DUF4062 domain-containing protein n=1 Tax=Cupriavidus consociatus TaxID=2821357 RepID=UPI001AE70600|nr:DUF4062 domain-containing protein [Cupriavidus sp. LEh21]MBP0624982.1 DUF4062 domain-containing protein [Cupriavidus sp. LEh25]MDK2661714.1 DUF4062 domain-containing protein [Cupriavidus sp. LEh21]
MEKRYQVFVSSTFRDLEVERQEVMHALLELDCIPSGMELFPATNETQWNLIKKVIDDCDYYILILGGRYGSIGPEGISYTEMEYRYALATGKPTIAFLHRSPGKIISENSEPTQEGKEKLQAFREAVEKKLCKHWDSPQELGSVVSRSLIQLIKSTPAVGWVRANELADREATMELLQLRRRVEDLQSELSKVRTSAPKGAEGLAQGNEEHSIKFAFNATAPREYRSVTWSSTFAPTWNDIFACIAPLMIHEAAEPTLKHAIDGLAEAENTERLGMNEKLLGHSLGGFRISQDDFQTIKVQLRALGLIAKNDKTRSVKDSGTYWTLTPYGDEVMTQLRAIRRNEDGGDASTEIVEGEGE